jgi:hypothetical protein
MRSENEVGYMAALLDGEGSLNSTRLIDKRSGRVSQGCRINVSAVSNSNPLIVGKAEQILKSWGIIFVTRETHPRFWAVDIRGTIDNKRKFLETVYDSLAGKKEQARLLLAFMKRRGNGKSVRVTESDRALLKRVNVLNHLNHLGSVTTARESFLETEEVKIQSELFGDKESPAEMTGPALVKKLA